MLQFLEKDRCNIICVLRDLAPQPKVGSQWDLEMKEQERWMREYSQPDGVKFDWYRLDDPTYRTYAEKLANHM